MFICYCSKQNVIVTKYGFVLIHRKFRLCPRLAYTASYTATAYRGDIFIIYKKIDDLNDIYFSNAYRHN